MTASPTLACGSPLWCFTRRLTPIRTLSPDLLCTRLRTSASEPEAAMSSSPAPSQSPLATLSRAALRLTCVLCVAAAAYQHYHVFGTLIALSREHRHHLPFVEKPLWPLAAPCRDDDTGDDHHHHHLHNNDDGGDGAGVVDCGRRSVPALMSLLDTWRTHYGPSGFDMSDMQLSAFYKYLGYQVVGLLLFAAVTQCLRHRLSEPATGRRVLAWYAGCGVAVVLGLHGLPGIVLLALLLFCYLPTTATAVRVMQLRRHPRTFHALLWAVQLLLLVAVKRTDGFAEWLPWRGVAQRRLAAVHAVAEVLRPWHMCVEEHMWVGLLPWTHVFPMCVLRMIAFSTDRFEATCCFESESSISRNSSRSSSSAGFAVEAGAEAAYVALYERHRPGRCRECDALQAVEELTGTDADTPVIAEERHCAAFLAQCPRAEAEYTLLGYLAYLLYAPLLLAGPLCTYNAFASYAAARAPTPWWRPWRGSLASYAVRTCVSLALLLLFAHYLHVSAFLVSNWILADLTPYEVFCIAYTHMAHLYLKFNAIWKLARCMALLDGVEVPEDMPRFYLDCLGVQDFWRHWHASFYAWILRYIYIPLGGRHRKALVLPLVFGFVGLWHELEPRLLWWAGGITLLFSAEGLARVCCAPLVRRWVRVKHETPVLSLSQQESGQFSTATKAAFADIVEVPVAHPLDRAGAGESAGVMPWRRHRSSSRLAYLPPRAVLCAWLLRWVVTPASCAVAASLLAIVIPIGFSSPSAAEHNDIAESVSIGSRLYTIYLGQECSVEAYATLFFFFLPTSFLFVCLRHHERR